MAAMRYSIRSLLTATFVAALFFSHLAWQTARRSELIRDIEQVGGAVEFDEHAKVKAVVLPTAALKDVRASRLKLFPNMSKLSLLVFEARNGDMHLKAARLDTTAINNELLDDLERRND